MEDADGLSEASYHSVQSTPTLLGFGKDGRIVGQLFKEIKLEEALEIIKRENS